MVYTCNLICTNATLQTIIISIFYTNDKANTIIRGHYMKHEETFVFSIKFNKNKHVVNKTQAIWSLSIKSNLSRKKIHCYYFHFE